MELLNTLINTIEAKLPTLTGYIYIDKLPTSANGVGIIFSEKVTLQQTLTFNDQAADYEKRTITVYVYSGTNEVAEARDQIYSIYNAFRDTPTITTKIDGVVPSTPTFVGEVENQKVVYVTQVTCYYRK